MDNFIRHITEHHRDAVEEWEFTKKPITVLHNLSYNWHIHPRRRGTLNFHRVKFNRYYFWVLPRGLKIQGGNGPELPRAVELQGGNGPRLGRVWLLRIRLQGPRGVTAQGGSGSAPSPTGRAKCRLEAEKKKYNLFNNS